MICQEYTRWAPSDLPLYMALWVFNWSYFSHGKDRGPPADRRPPLVRLAARKWEWAPSNIRRKRHAKRKKKTARTSKSTILGGRISLKFASKIVESCCLLLTPYLGSMLRLGHLLKWLVRFTSNIHTEGIWLWTRPEAYLRCACWSCILQGPSIRLVPCNSL